MAVGFLVLDDPPLARRVRPRAQDRRADGPRREPRRRRRAPPQARRLDTANAGISGAQLLALLAAAVAFIVWLWRARTNVGSYGWTKQRRSRGWAIGAWFVPFVAFWFPFQVTADIWKAEPSEARSATG